MCVYCMISDWQFTHNPPWDPNVYPAWPGTIPQPSPATTTTPWGITQLKEFQDLLKRVKELEDKLGCPCEPKEADYIELLKKRIEYLEAQVK